MPRSRSLSVAATLVALLAAPLACAWAEGLGTANLLDAEPWTQESTLVSGEIRAWSSDNLTYAVRGLSRVGVDLDAEFTAFYMDIRGEDPIAGAVRDSEGLLLGLNLKWLAHQDEKLTVAVIPGVEYPLDELQGTNTALSASALSDDLIPVLSVPILWRSEEGLVVSVVPRYVGFDEAPDTGAFTIEGFGDTVALGAGALYRRDRYAAHADVQVVLEGHNVIDPATNDVDRDNDWSAGGGWIAEDG
ncbi:MAG: hypothetical protein AB7Y46_04395, partial [Armatimonadota bacterium]